MPAVPSAQDETTAEPPWTRYGRSAVAAPGAHTEIGGGLMTDQELMNRQSEMAQDAYRELGKIVFGDQPLDAVLMRVAELARDVIPEVDDASVTLIRHRRPTTVVFTSELAVELDERQYETGFGPCMDAAESGETIPLLHSDVATATYPRFSEAAQRRGITRTLSVGLPIPHRVVGALNLYSRVAEPFTPGSVATAEAFAGYAGVALANAELVQASSDLADQMHNAMQTRAVIEQAKGVVMARERCSADQAFQLLTTMSQHRNIKLNQLAEMIVHGVATASTAGDQRAT